MNKEQSHELIRLIEERKIPEAKAMMARFCFVMDKALYHYCQYMTGEKVSMPSEQPLAVKLYYREHNARRAQEQTGKG